MKPKNKDLGRYGEDIACSFLKKKGFKIIDRNFTCSIGELDIIAFSFTQKQNFIKKTLFPDKPSALHFIEVKSGIKDDVFHETNIDFPLENFTSQKFEKIKKLIDFYLAEKKIPEDVNIYVDLIMVYFSHQGGVSEVKMIDNIV